MRASAPTAAAPRATARTEAARIHAVRFFMGAALALDDGLEVVGALPRFRGVDARGELLGQPLVGSRGLGVTLRALEDRAQREERVVAPDRGLRVLSDLAIGVDGLGGLSAAHVKVGEGEAGQRGARRVLVLLPRGVLQGLLRLRLLPRLPSGARPEVTPPAG